MAKVQPNSLSTFPPLPITARGFGIHINGTTKGSARLIYCNGKHVIIRNIDNPSDVTLFSGHQANVTTAKFSPNGEYVASGDEQGRVIVWAAKNYIEKNNLFTCRGVLDIDWTGDGKRIVAVGDGGAGQFAKVFSWDSSNAIGEMTNNSKKILTCAFRPDRPYKIVVGNEDKQLNFYEGPPFKFARSSREHSNYPNCIRYSPNGEKFASVGSDQKIVIYDGETGDKIKEMPKAHGGSIYSCSWSPDSSKLLTCSGDKKVKVWDVESGEATSEWKMGSTVSDMQVSCLWLGDRLITVSLSGAINFLSESDTSGPSEVWRGHQSPIDSISCSPDGSSIFSACRGGRLVKWNAKTATCEEFAGDGHGDNPISGLACNSDGTKLYSIGYDDKMIVSQIETLTTLDQWQDLEGQPKCIAAAHNNPDLCVVGTGKGILYMCIDGRAVGQVPLGFTPSCVEFSPDDSELLIGGDKFAQLYHVDGTSVKVGTKLGEPHNDIVSSACYSPDGKWVTTTDKNRQVFVWNRQDLSKPINANGWKFHQARIPGSVWKNDSSMLATASADEMIIIWPRATEGKHFKKKKIDPTHLGGVHDLKVLNDDTLASVGDDKCIRLWKFEV